MALHLPTHFEEHKLCGGAGTAAAAAAGWLGLLRALGWIYHELWWVWRAAAQLQQPVFTQSDLHAKEDAKEDAKERCGGCLNPAARQLLVAICWGPLKLLLQQLVHLGGTGRRLLQEPREG